MAVAAYVGIAANMPTLRPRSDRKSMKGACRDRKPVLIARLTRWEPPVSSRQSGRSSGVEHNLAKVGVEGSNPFARSSFFLKSSMPCRSSKRSCLLSCGLPLCGRRRGKGSPHYSAPARSSAQRRRAPLPWASRNCGPGWDALVRRAPVGCADLAAAFCHRPAVWKSGCGW
jgi:hypothetical protein